MVSMCSHSKRVSVRNGGMTVKNGSLDLVDCLPETMGRRSSRAWAVSHERSSSKVGMGLLLLDFPKAWSGSNQTAVARDPKPWRA